MKSIKNALVRTGLLISALFLFSFTSCKGDPEYIDVYVNLQATWVDSYSSYYEITSSTFKNYGEGYSSYEGNNLIIQPISEDSGTIFIKYTKALCTTHSDFGNSLYTYDSDAADVGKWYAISYKDLTSSSVKLSGAYGSTEGHYATSCDSLDGAIEEFTIENGYFAYYSECIKSKN